MLCLSLMSIYVVFVIIAENEFYDGDCVLSIEGPAATNNNKCRLGPLPPLPKEVSSDNQTLNMSFFGRGRVVKIACFVLISLLEINIFKSCLQFKRNFKSC